jgi:uncharacterized protein
MFITNCFAALLVACSSVYGGQANHKPSTVPRIIAAVKTSDLVSVKTLLAHGADPNTRDGQGKSALLWAAEDGNRRMCKLLLASGANPAIKDFAGRLPVDAAYHGQAFGQDPLHFHDYVAVANLLVRAMIGRRGDPLIVAVETDDIQGVRRLLANHTDTNRRDAHGCTPLMWAAHRGSLTMCELLMTHGAKPDLQDQRGHTALMIATGEGLICDDCVNHYSELAFDYD